MLLRQVLELFDLLDTPAANGKQITELLKSRGAHEVSVETVTGDEAAPPLLWASSDVWEA